MTRGLSDGKRPMKAMHSNFVGVSATQMHSNLIGASPTCIPCRRGELPYYSPGLQPPGLYPPGLQPPAETWSEVNYNKPWFMEKDGSWYCNLCGAWATDMHVYSIKHSHRAANPEWYGYPPASVEGVPAQQVQNNQVLVQNNQVQNNPGGWTTPDFNKPYFEKRDGDYYCNLCSAWATDGHVNSDKHQRRAEQATWYNDPQSTAASSSSWPGSPDFSASYFEFRDGDWYCKLCANWATPDHVASDKHKKRAAYPDWYGFPEANASGASASSAVQTQATAALPPPWEQHYSAEHQTYYYYNATTGISTWERPVAQTQQLYANTATSTPWPASTAATPSTTLASLPYPWEKHECDAHVRPYYYNKETRQSQWEPPFGNGLHEC